MDYTEYQFWKRGGWEPGSRRAGTLPSPAVLFNLDKSTLLDRMRSDVPAERRLYLRWYREAKVLQGSWGVYKPQHPKSGTGKLTLQQLMDNQRRATQRAAANIKRDLLSICADRMITLTYVSNQQDRAAALLHLRQWLRVMRRIYPSWQSVAVLEYQKRGAVHFHIAVTGFYDVVVLRSEWQDIIGEKAIVNMAFAPDGRGNPCGKLASYMGKYLAKDVDQGRSFGEHRYFRTGAIERPKEIFYIPAGSPYGLERELTFDAIITLLGTEGHFPTMWSRSSQERFSGFIVGSRDS